MNRYYLSKNYKDLSNAGNKAKTDAERILMNLGYKNAGLPQTVCKNEVLGFLVTLLGIIKMPFCISKGDLLVLQYPLKKYYTLACRIAHFRGCFVVTLIHDLGSFRRKKLTIPKEIKKLGNSDYLIVHNRFMKEWLLDKGYEKAMGSLEIFDYLSDTEAAERQLPDSAYRVIYAGGLSYKKNRFLYTLDSVINSWSFNLYGGGFELDRIKNKDRFNYKGFIPSDRLIATVEGDFGLVWDGESAETCAGSFGEYLQYNNPHKASLYIRCHLPIIIWDKAALSYFVRTNKIGICIVSLEELNTKLLSVTQEEYASMKANVMKISCQLAAGYNLSRAIAHAEQNFKKNRLLK